MDKQTVPKNADVHLKPQKNSQSPYDLVPF